MDTSILQLFTAEEILKRLTKKEATGALHVFTPRESANIFLKAGTIVAASKGMMEGEEVLQLILTWEDAKFSWQEGISPAAGLKPVEIVFPNLENGLKPALKAEVKEKKFPAPKAPKPPETKTILASGLGAAATGPMTLRPSKALNPKPREEALSSAPAASTSLVPVVELSATKPMHKGLEIDSFEEALMRKHQLALVAVGETPAQRLRIIRSSNLVGRNPACDFTLNHNSVSRQHCLLQIMERGLHVKDLSSSNGTKVNGINLTEGYVSVGDKLTIGHLHFLVEKDVEPPA